MDSYFFDPNTWLLVTATLIVGYLLSYWLEIVIYFLKFPLFYIKVAIPTLKKLKKEKELFNTFPAPLEWIVVSEEMQKYSFVLYQYRRVLLNKFIFHIKKIKDQKKFLSALNNALKILFELENSSVFKTEVIKQIFVLYDEKEILGKIQNFSKFKKDYVLSELINHFNDNNSEEHVFLLRINEILYENILSYVVKARSIPGNLMRVKLFNPEQKGIILGFLKNT